MTIHEIRTALEAALKELQSGNPTDADTCKIISDAKEVLKNNDAIGMMGSLSGINDFKKNL